MRQSERGSAEQTSNPSVFARLESVPGPGAAPLVVPTAAALLRRNATVHADRLAVLFEDLRWTHADLWREASRLAAAFERWRPADPAVPFHVGVLMDNTPTYVAALGAASLTGAALVGLNPTRRGEHLARDIAHVDLCALLVEPRYAGLLPSDPQLAVDRVATDRVVLDIDALHHEEPRADPGPEHDPPVETTWCLVFTSGTSSAPKAVICSQRRLLVTGERLRTLLGVGPGDVGYLCIPLFHSNSLMVGLLPALLAGAAVALRPRFSASGWLPDVRRYGVTYWNYTGKPLAYLLATPQRADDADNPLRRAYGNEGSDAVVRRFAERFGAEVLDAFGPTEGGVGIVRHPDAPPGALGHVGAHVRVVGEDGVELPRATFGSADRLLNAQECVGEIVNTAGPGPFEGYYNNPEATARATRGGWYWSGDLGYVDEAGYVYFAGRAFDWLRVDGENFPAAPIEAVVSRHPDVLAAAVYAVPDAQAGDQVMAAVEPRPGARFDPAEFAEWLAAQADLTPKWHPRYVRVSGGLPRTPTHKVLHRVLAAEKFRLDRVGGDPVWVRDGASYRPLTADDERALRAAFAEHGRERFWDL